MKFNRFLSFLLFLTFSLLLVSCDAVPPAETTEKDAPIVSEVTTTETTTAAQTTAAETTTAAATEEEPKPEKNGRMYSWWSPSFSWTFYPWTISPDYVYESAEDYDIEITGISDEVYDSLPRTVTLQITNKTGKPITQYGSPYLEIYEATMFEGVGSWVRMPYIVEEEAVAGVTLRESSYEYELGIRDNMLPIFDFPAEYALYYTMDIRDEARSEVLRCRIVFYLNDGPHYVEFRLEPSSDPRQHYFPSEYKWPYGSWRNVED